MQNAPVCIIGAGLAGTLVAEALLARHPGIRLRVWDAALPGAASAAAAGLANPLTGKYLTLSPHVPEQMAALRAVATRHPEVAAYLRPVPLYRPFQTEAEAQKWAVHATESPYHQWVDYNSSSLSCLHNPLGGLWVRGAMAANTPNVLAELRQKLESQGVEYRTDPFLYTKLNPETLTYKGEIYGKVIFADGVGALQNPLWPFRPIAPLKGERFALWANGLPGDYAFSRGVYLVPQPDGSHLLGATHDRYYAHIHPTPEGRVRLLAELQYWFPDAEVKEVFDHRAGIRPTTYNHQPICAAHPDYPNICFFNGLGTKGLLQGPLLAWGLAGTRAWDS